MPPVQVIKMDRRCLPCHTAQQGMGQPQTVSLPATIKTGAQPRPTPTERDYPIPFNTGRNAAVPGDPANVPSDSPADRGESDLGPAWTGLLLGSSYGRGKSITPWSTPDGLPFPGSSCPRCPTSTLAVFDHIFEYWTHAGRVLCVGLSALPGWQAAVGEVGFERPPDGDRVAVVADVDRLSRANALVRQSWRCVLCPFTGREGFSH